MEGTRNLELRLGLPGADDVQRNPARGTKRVLEDDTGCEIRSSEPGSSTGNDKEATQPASNSKEQVVGWPPVRSYRKNALQVKKTEAASGCMVKVSLDGAPYLRKMDLNNYGGYKELREALESMFKGFSLGEISEMEGCNYAITYEDKDQDLMLVGDVPWDMFISSCKRLRIMRRTDAGFSSKQ